MNIHEHPTKTQMRLQMSGLDPYLTSHPKYPRNSGSDVKNVEKSFFIIQITGRMSDGQPGFSGISGRMSDTGPNPTSVPSSEFLLDAHV